MFDLLNCIKTFLSGSWDFFTETDVPGLGFSFAVLFIGLALIPISLSFLSLILGFPVGNVSEERLRALCEIEKEKLRVAKAYNKKVREKWF